MPPFPPIDRTEHALLVQIADVAEAWAEFDGDIGKTAENWARLVELLEERRASRTSAGGSPR